MVYRDRDGDRIFGGSMEPRLNPHFGGDKLNTKLGPRFDGIRNTERRSPDMNLDPHRLHHTGLPPRLGGQRM